ncbi:MAG: hypothetical protein ABJH98_05805 [Reichenbachiella sp.]|uniref:hypothetical protein n=1 Tax=Reichenbachiella sp. TaxID=2184521 RepID=UPI003297BEF5
MPSSSIKYDKEYCQIYHEQDPNCIRLVWDGFSKPEEFREACNYVLDLLVEYGTGSLIVDNRKSTVISKENQEWLSQEWYPLAYTKGYRTSAVIVGDNSLNKISIKKIENLRDGAFNTKHFEEIESAKDWLKSL